jgi:predicted DNA binding protein
MLADPRRVRLLIAGSLILLAATLLRLTTDVTVPTASVDADARVRVAATTASEAAAQDRDNGRSGSHDDAVGPEPEQLELDEAHQVAADFAVNYLTWRPEETHAQRLDRLTVHTSDDLAAQLEDARGTGEAADGPAEEQAAEVTATQTLTVRQTAVEIAVMTELTTPGQDPVPASLTVVLTTEHGGWIVDDLR